MLYTHMYTNIYIYIYIFIHICISMYIYTKYPRFVKAPERELRTKTESNGRNRAAVLRCFSFQVYLPDSNTHEQQLHMSAHTHNLIA